MGFKISWLAFAGKGKKDILASLHLIDTGIVDEAMESPLTIASFPNGWTIIVLNRFDHPLAEDASLRLLSKRCEIIVGHVHEGIMFGSTQLYRDGAMIWSIFHDAQQGLYHLETEGSPPESLSLILARQKAEQDRNGGKDAEVDYMIDVPFAVASSLSGFEYSRWRYEWGEPQFTELRDEAELQ
jgi:hypothetical protein